MAAKIQNASQPNPVETARSALRVEANALEKLADSIGQPFVDAVETMATASGRVILCGIGKSGHVARKISATFASTGTPSFFVHAAEASHGDLGMITKADVVLMLSNSGNTAELRDIITYCTRFAIPMIGMTSSGTSTLAEHANVKLILPKAEEACPMGLAPTTSTTLMMALGDALAIALLERNGFSSDGFSTFHPGGRLGQMLVRVKDVMLPAEQLPLVRQDTEMANVIVAMTAQVSGIAIVADGRQNLIGIITDGDLRRHMSPKLLAMRAAEVMTTDPRAISDQILAAEALRIMNEGRITSLLVTDEQRLVGMVHLHDLLRSGVA